ncbi:MAG: thioredoxin domain-containing protein [Patescibacteria group bacterium]
MNSKAFYIIFSFIIIISLVIIVLFAQSIIGPFNGINNGVKTGSSKNKDIFVTPAPDVEKTDRIPPLERKDPIIGNPEGEITIIEFADFECQYCAEAQKTLEEILKIYPDKIRLVWKNYPLAFHSYSKKAAEAALCANEQKKFSQMQNQLFEHQNISLLPKDIKEYAKDIGLDMDKFNTCFDGGLNEEAVSRDIAAARQFGVDSVPSFFIFRTNSDQGYFISWAATLNELKATIDALLK